MWSSKCGLLDRYQARKYMIVTYACNLSRVTLGELTNKYVFSKFLVIMKEHVLFGVYGKGEVAEVSFIGYQGCFRRCSLTFISKTEDMDVMAFYFT